MNELREYDVKDKEKVIQLILEICIDEYGLHEYKNDLIKHIEQKEFIKTWVMLDNEEIIATACYTERDEKIAEIKKVYIKKKYRKQGLGRKIIENVIKEIESKGYNSIYVGTSNHFDNALSFYNKLGFKFKFYEGNGYILEMKLA